MQFFDLLFIVLLLTSVGSLATAAWLALRRQFGRSRTILTRLLTGAVIYFATVIGASLILPRKVWAVGDPQCFDDWCISLTGSRRTLQQDQVSYVIDLRLFSRARGIRQREKNLAVYLTDSQGRRYDPVTDQNATPFSVLLGPGEAVTASRLFLLPANAAEVAAVITHEGGFPIGWFIVGYDTWFRKPPIVRLQ